MYMLAKALLASLLGAGAVATMESSPLGSLLIGSLSVMMWFSIMTDVIRVMRFFGA